MNKSSKKLELSKETLRTLNDEELSGVVGGASGICVNTVICQSGVCHSAVCESVALCQSGICG